MKGTAHRNKKPFDTKIKVNTCTNFPFEEELEKDGEIEVLAISLLLHLRILSCTETLVGHVMCLKGLIAAAFESSEPLHLLRFNGRVGTVPT